MTMKLPNPFVRVLDEAKHALGYRDLVAVGATEPHARMAQPAVASGTIFLDKGPYLVQQGKQEGLYRVDNLPAGETIDIRASVIERSRVARAGARVIVAAERPAPTNDIGAFYSDAGLVRAIDPAPFANVADGADAQLSPFPFHDALLRWANAPSVGTAFNITRRQQKDFGGGAILESALFTSVIDGLILQADKVLLAAIVATNPAAFMLGAAAARNLEFSDLRALVGTSGLGAAVGQDGALRAGGVAAELTSGMAGTIVGAFGRCAVAIRPEIHFHIKRMDLDGNMNCTVFASIQALVPDASTFWKLT